MAAQLQIPLKLSPMRIVARDAGCDLVVPRINDPLSDRMTELALALMTWQTDFIAVTL
jgi:hypothetical protein